MRIRFSLTLLAAFLISTSANTQPAIETAPVFRAGEDGYHTFRIPAAVVAANGDVLAFAEGRSSRNDHANNDLVMKRSTDNGRTWSAIERVASDGSNALNNPCVLRMRDSGRILLMFQRYPNGYDEHRVKPGITGEKIVRTWVMHSDDHGASWSDPRDVTRDTKPAWVTSVAGGPGNGIQLRRGPFAGRILMPFNHGPYGDWRVYAVFSDDGGETWSYGMDAVNGTPGLANEVQFIENTLGFVMLNARSFDGAPLRKTTFSIDSGLSWTAPLQDIPDLVEPSCMASMIRYSDPLDNEPSVLLYSGPRHETKRVNGTLMQSQNEGRTWTEVITLHEGHFAYSHLTRLADDTIGCLYETGEAHPYARIAFARVPASTLDPGP